MRSGRPTLAILFAAASAAAAAFAGAGAAADDGITVYRCEAAGRVTLQDEPCPAGQAQTTRRMVRPQDAPPAPPPAAPPPPPDVLYGELPPLDYPPEFEGPLAPPPMFQCTDYDGETRTTEEYAPNTRCVPLPVLGYRVRPGSDAAATCRWVQESCLRLDDTAACDAFRAKLKAARSDALHASGTTAPYRKSEAERLARIVDESC